MVWTRQSEAVQWGINHNDKSKRPVLVSPKNEQDPYWGIGRFFGLGDAPA
jgi:hypothetical protein